jgi:hypothetical protein
MRPDGRRKLWPAVLAAMREIADPNLPACTVLRFCQACGRDRIVVVERSCYGDGLGRRHIVASSREIESLVALHAEQRQAMAEELETPGPARLSVEIDALLGGS